MAGRHLDNVAPSLLGGIVLVRSMDPLDLVRCRSRPSCSSCSSDPSSGCARRRRAPSCRATLPLATALHQAAQVAAMVAALALGDYALLGRAIDDRIAEPARAALLPGFAEAKAAALAAGALGSSISGAARRRSRSRAGETSASAWPRRWRGVRRGRPAERGPGGAGGPGRGARLIETTGGTG